eukprot:TRINITY_DN4148_c0_g1_i1.p1 TRINITY_DN4148_c0_g1~~TRINITY_DN4148_c0_g1_i1.p1  ORF type:complete len:168 (+),score=26.75 TRINITY_DN4148_c0_g1_i1:68-505(+)
MVETLAGAVVWGAVCGALGGFGGGLAANYSIQAAFWQEDTEESREYSVWKGRCENVKHDACCGSLAAGGPVGAGAGAAAHAFPQCASCLRFTASAVGTAPSVHAGTVLVGCTAGCAARVAAAHAFDPTERESEKTAADAAMHNEL